MGSRSKYETTAAVIQAFARQNVWGQAELATRVGVQSRTLRAILQELQSSHMPLEREAEHPHVYWSVPRGWFPGGVVFEQKDWPVLVDAIARVPSAERKGALLRRLVAGQPAGAPDALERLSQAVSATALDAEQHAIFLVLQEGILQRQAVEVKYYSNTSQELAWRVLTPQRLIEHPRPRFVAYCHRHKELRWFRLSNAQRARLSTDEPYVECQTVDVNAFIERSVDGYYDGGDEELAFVVRKPEANWVRDNLLQGMQIDERNAPREGIRVVTRGATLVVARFVAGLGGAARAEGQALRALVCQLAQETLDANK